MQAGSPAGQVLLLSGRPIEAVTMAPLTGWMLRRAGNPYARAKVTDPGWMHRLAEVSGGLEPGTLDAMPACDVVVLVDVLHDQFDGLPGAEIFDLYYRLLDLWRDRSVFDMTPRELLFDTALFGRLRTADQKRAERKARRKQGMR